MRRTERAHASLFGAAALASVVSLGMARCRDSVIPDTSRRTPVLLTVTELPPFPDIPRDAPSWSRERQIELIRKIADHKIGTYPQESSRPHRIGKYTSTGLFSSFQPTEEQVRRIAPHYDNVLMMQERSDVALLFRKYNPHALTFMYFDAGLTPGISNSTDAGSVDAEDTAWILKNHPEWILRDKRGRLVQNSGRARISRAKSYWADPGDTEWRAFFSRKLNKAIEKAPGAWDGVLLDEFYGRATSFAYFGGAPQQVKYPDDASFQKAQIEFLTEVCARVKLPIIANVEPGATAQTPEFFLKLVDAAGGAENEVFPHESSDVSAASNVGPETLKLYMDTILRAPRDKHIRLNSKPGGLAGDIDRTIYAFCTYLLVAGKDREIYWTMKEGDSDIPHYWYREFDLDLGDPLGEYEEMGDVWKREFKRATVLVNPRRRPNEFAFEGEHCDILGKPIARSVSLPPFGGLFLFRDRSALDEAIRGAAGARGETRTEFFDRDPGWKGVNNRSARESEPATIRQEFGYSPSNRAGGNRGEIGGFMHAAGEAAYYGKVIERRTFADPFRASGKLACSDGVFHVLVGLFNSGTVKEWRTPNTIAIRLNGRGDHFFAYVEYCTSRWRAGGDTTPFPSRKDPETGRMGLIGFPSGGKVHRWTLSYDPQGNGGRGVVTATIDDATAICELDEGHKADGAVFDRFGILNVMKSADSGGEIFLDDIALDGAMAAFDGDPGWEGRNNRRTYASKLVRPRFDFGYSPTNHAGGKSPGELGGTIFRGDCRYPDRMACLGDDLGPLTLDRPMRASGKIALLRGVSDSTVLFGFYSSKECMRRNDSQSDGLPEGVVGACIEGPSRDGFFLYPVCRTRGGNGRSGLLPACPHIYPDGASHDWSIEYDPSGAGGRGRITVALDGRSASLDLEEGARASGTRLDRFGIVTTWIDGNSQDVYWDDLAYTVGQ